MLDSALKERKRRFCWDLGHGVCPSPHDPGVRPREVGTEESEAMARVRISDLRVCLGIPEPLPVQILREAFSESVVY